MVSQDLNGILATFQVVPPVLEGLNNSYYLLVRRPIVQLGTLELSGVKGNGMPTPVEQL